MESGIEDKVNIIKMFRDKTKQLQNLKKTQMVEEEDSSAT